MIEALIAGEKDVTVLADLAQRQLRGKIPEVAACFGRGADRASPLFVAAVARTVPFSRKGDRQFGDTGHVPARLARYVLLGVVGGLVDAFGAQRMLNSKFSRTLFSRSWSWMTV